MIQSNLKFALACCMVIFCLGKLCPAAKSSSRFKELLIPIDLYAVPNGIKRTMKIKDLYKAIADQGIVIKIAKKDFMGADIKYTKVQMSFYPTPTLSTGATYSQSSSSGVKTFKQIYTLGNTIEVDSPWGAKLTLDLPKIQKESSSGGTTNTVEHSVTLGTNLTIKLLKGAPYITGDITQTEAGIDLKLARLTLKTTALSTLKSGEDAFYDVLLKRLRVKVLALALESSKALLSDINAMYKAGEGDKLSIIKVQLQVAQTETDLLSGQAEAETAMQTLRDVISLNEEGAAIFPDPTEIKSAPALPDLGLSNNIKKAKRNRPDYQSAILNLKKASLSERKAKSDTLPQVDLIMGYGYVGKDASFSGAFSSPTLFRDPTYTIGVSLTYPLWNNTAFQDHTTAKLETQKKELGIRQLNSQVAKEISSALNSVDLGYRRLKTSELAKSLSEQKLAAEFEKFRVGESSIRNIVDFQTEVNNARISELSARVDYLRSISALRNALGVYPPSIAAAEFTDVLEGDV